MLLVILVVQVDLVYLALLVQQPVLDFLVSALHVFYGESVLITMIIVVVLLTSAQYHADDYDLFMVILVSWLHQ